jgi:ABC-type antimicrobial peptide transport system permease subunit
MSLTLQSTPRGDWAIDQDPAVLTGIYDAATSIAIWQRQLQQGVQSYLAELMRKSTKVTLKSSGTPRQLMEEVRRVFPPTLISE